jgi:hypothetical protein
MKPDIVENALSDSALDAGFENVARASSLSIGKIWAWDRHHNNKSVSAKPVTPLQILRYFIINENVHRESRKKIYEIKLNFFFDFSIKLTAPSRLASKLVGGVGSAARR